MLKSVVRLAFLALALAGTVTAAHAASGQAQAVDPDAEARGNQSRTLVVGSDIFIGDRIVTGASGEVQILFEDDTRLVVGPRSALLIDDYLLREDGSAGKMVLDVLGGTFRFITGGSAKDKYQINTPSGTIGVRGTAFQIYSIPDLADYILVEEGVVTGCGEGGGECATSEGLCEIMVIKPNSAEIAGQTDDYWGEERDKIKEWFKYSNQRGLLERYRVRNAERCMRRSPGGGGGSISDPGEFVDNCDDGCECDNSCIINRGPGFDP